MNDCLFCKIVTRAVPAKIVYEDEHAVAFDDIRPQAPVHTLVIPKRHVQSIQALEGGEAALLGHLVLTTARVADVKGIAGSGYRVVTNTGADAGQTVFHLHFHILGGRPMSWPPG